ncbi:hypothetical protein AZE42_12489 [Rhizopogon vesiculosus]|uniref:Uncharacterized protein n=1 Tax=Rhizopogon vesiculosus TaxID=180088 RepID=A0A1J8Q6M3_9AGAM|nr:hypothetical protein AZE42_12489 [Rhizopogon vesiculosus]
MTVVSNDPIYWSIIDAYHLNSFSVVACLIIVLYDWGKLMFIDGIQVIDVHIVFSSTDIRSRGRLIRLLAGRAISLTMVL